MDLLQACTRIQSELIDQHRARLRERVERFTAPAGVVQRDHELTPAALVERIQLDGLAQQRQGRLWLVRLEVGLDELCGGLVVEQLQPCTMVVEPRGVRHVLQRRASPHGERLPQRPERRARIGILLGIAQQVLEARGIHRGVLCSELVPGRTVLDRQGARLAQAGHVRLERVQRVGGRIQPQVPDEHVLADRLAASQRQMRDDQSLLGAADQGDAVLGAHADRAQHEKFDHARAPSLPGRRPLTRVAYRKRKGAVAGRSPILRSGRRASQSSRCRIVVAPSAVTVSASPSQRNVAREKTEGWGGA
nr:hypothetical protein [Agrococcus baldri]